MRPDHTLFNGITHYPERRADLEAKWLDERIEQIRQKAAALTAMTGCHYIAPEVVDDLVARHERITQAYWNSEGRCMSAFIVGPANFPTERNRKRQGSAEKRRQEVRDHLRAALKRLHRLAFPDGEPGGPIKSSNPQAEALIRKKIARLEETRETYRACAKAVRRNDWEEVEALVGAANAHRAEKLIAEGWGYKPFEATRFSAEIKRLEERLKSLAATEQRGRVETEHEGVVVIENPDLMRVQMVFDQVPDATLKGHLKSMGFRWAPSEGAWQRHLNNAGRAACSYILNRMKEATC